MIKDRLTREKINRSFISMYTSCIHGRYLGKLIPWIGPSHQLKYHLQLKTKERKRGGERKFKGRPVQKMFDKQRLPCPADKSLRWKKLPLIIAVSLMPKTWPLCTDTKSNLGDQALGEVEKNNFIALSGKGGHSGLLPSKTVCPNLGGFGEEFYSSGSRVGLLIRIRVCAGPALL